MSQEKQLSWRIFIAQTLVASLLSASIIGAFVQYAINQAEFSRSWKQRQLSEVIAPVVMHLDRTSRVAARYGQDPESYFDAQIMRDSNATVRNILLTKGDLIPDDLLEYSHKLVEHFDVWIRQFDEKAVREKPNPDSQFDVGFAKPEFPEQAVPAFQKYFVKLRDELHGE